VKFVPSPVEGRSAVERGSPVQGGSIVQPALA
jgi:hypothetical protein